MSLGLGLTKSWEGQMRKAMTDEARAARTGATGGMRVTIEQLKNSVRAEMTAAGLGSKVPNSVRGHVFPKTGIAMNPAGSISSNAPHIMAAFNQTQIIRPRNGGAFMAIPTADAPAGPRGKRHISAAEAVKKFGEPEFLRSPGGTLFMLFEVQRAPDGSGWRKARFGKPRRGVAAEPKQLVAMFILKPMVSITKRIDPAAALARAGSMLRPNIAAAWPRSESSS